MLNVVGYSPVNTNKSVRQHKGKEIILL